MRLVASNLTIRTGSNMQARPRQIGISLTTLVLHNLVTANLQTTSSGRRHRGLELPIRMDHKKIDSENPAQQNPIFFLIITIFHHHNGH
jgi:hypothetical protein